MLNRDQINDIETAVRHLFAIEGNELAKDAAESLLSFLDDATSSDEVASVA